MSFECNPCVDRREGELADCTLYSADWFTNIDGFVKSTEKIWPKPCPLDSINTKANKGQWAMTPPRTEISSLKFLGYNLCLGPLGPSNNWLCRVSHPPTLLTISIVPSLQSLTNHEKTINKLFHMEYFPVFPNPGLIFLSASSVKCYFINAQCHLSSCKTKIWVYGKDQVSFCYH